MCWQRRSRASKNPAFERTLIMNIHNARVVPGRRSLGRFLATSAMVGLTLCASLPANAAFHLWSIREVYTDASGTLQFIELFTTSGFETLTSGQQIHVTNLDRTITHSFTVPNGLSGSTANRALLFGTAAITNFGAPKPDFIIPTNFLFAEGGSIKNFGTGSGPYTALPTDGTLSRTWGGGNAINSPQNFSGQSNSIVLSVNAPPFVTITNPLNNALFIAPGTVSVGAMATDNVSVASVELMTNGVIAGAADMVPPYAFTLSNLPAGSYTLRARALDNQAAASTSAPVNVRIASLPTLQVLRGSNGPIQLRHNSATGINYVVERAVPLTNFSSIVTNVGNGGVLQFAETNGGAVQRTYRIRLQ
jgi:hypothetical protein